MKILLDMVISPNGMIARENGDEDWLPHEGWDEFAQEAARYGNIIMGRETYELVMKNYNDGNFDDIQAPYKIIVTENPAFSAPTGYTVVHSPGEAVRLIEKAGLLVAFVIGGGKLNGAFAAAGLLDEIHLTTVPHLIGQGRPLFGGFAFDMPLRLVRSEVLSLGRVYTVYEVMKDNDDLAG